MLIASMSILSRFITKKVNNKIKKRKLVNIMEQNIEDIKRKILPTLQQFDVVKASIFGSQVRGEATTTSDLDLIVEFSGKKSLFDLVNLKLALEELLQSKVDVLTYNSIHPLIKDLILSEEVVIYG